MLPTVDAVYSAAKAVFLPPLRYGLQWTIEGATNIPEHGATILASNHVSYLDPLTLAFVAAQRGRRVRFLAKSELFENPVLGVLLNAAHQIPVYRGTAESSGALSAAVEALARGECVAVFPEGTISQDFEPMRGKSGTARLASASGVAVVPVGLWGTHRILTKGRKPHPAWGVAEVAVVGQPVVVGQDERAADATRRVMDAITACVARAREIYPQRPVADDDGWWWRDPETATAHRRPANVSESDA
jgi:1-acyl-sn-glycerol-3-phosphate acyltransferase